MTCCAAATTRIMMVMILLLLLMMMIHWPELRFLLVCLFPEYPLSIDCSLFWLYHIYHHLILFLSKVSSNPFPIKSGIQPWSTKLDEDLIAFCKWLLSRGRCMGGGRRHADIPLARVHKLEVFIIKILVTIKLSIFFN